MIKTLNQNLCCEFDPSENDGARGLLDCNHHSDPGLVTAWPSAARREHDVCLRLICPLISMLC